MRSALKYILTAFGAIVLILLGFTVETTADELGFTATVRSMVRGGSSAMFSWEYAEWLFAAFWFLAGASAALWLDGLIRQKTTVTIPKAKKITRDISGQNFRNERVVLDGASYQNCTFENVTFIFNGGLFRLSDNKINGFLLASDVPEIEAHGLVLFQLGLLRVAAVGPKGQIDNLNKVK